MLTVFGASLGGLLLQRLLQALLLGAGVGLLLRRVFGRGSMRALVVLAHAPLVLSVYGQFVWGRRLHVAASTSTSFVLASAAIVAGSLLLGLKLSRRWAWLIALLPAISAAAYLIWPFENHQTELAKLALLNDSLPSSGIVIILLLLLTPFLVALLAAFAPARIRWLERRSREPLKTAESTPIVERSTATHARQGYAGDEVALREQEHQQDRQ